MDEPFLASIGLDRSLPEPLQIQLYRQMRRLIAGGRLRDGARLPSTRGLAADLSVSRTTTLAAYDQLAAEGLIEQRRGSGAFVTAPAAERAAPIRRRADFNPIVWPETALHPKPFDMGIPDYRSFPAEQWARAMARAWRRHGPGSLVAPPGGDPGLRQAIADHLEIARGLQVAWTDIVVTSGMRETLSLIAHTLLNPGDTVVVEDPGYPIARRALRDTGLRTVGAPVDAAGLRLTSRHRFADMRAVLVTPAWHFPLGVTLSAERRTALVTWAEAGDRYIIEDDYDSEYRYRGRPLAPLFGRVASDRIVHIGSFSKVMFAGLRLAYLVAAPGIVERILDTQRVFGPQASIVPQIGLAEFIRSGAFARHIRRTRRLYRRRQEALVDAVSRHLDGFLTVTPLDAGIHLVAAIGPVLAERYLDVELSQLAGRSGIHMRPLSQSAIELPSRQGLLLGYAAFDEREITSATRALRMVFDQHL